MDSEQIRQVHLQAFPTSGEADLVERLIADEDAAISLVACDHEAVVGHILFSWMRVEADGKAVKALALAPVAVLPERQRNGIGSQLIETGLEDAALIGAGLVFVLGEPEYYSRFGFDAAAARPFASPYAGPYLQARILSEAYRNPSSGTAEHPRAFAALE